MELLKIITENLQSFSDGLSRRINFDINRFCFEMGLRINQALSMTGTAQPDAQLVQTSDSIEAVFGKKIGVEHLRQMCRYATQIPERTIASRIAKLITWRHIELVLEPGTIQETLYYARIAGERGLNPSELKSVIAENEFMQNVSAKILEDQFIDAVQNPHIEQLTEQSGNSTFETTVYHVSLGADTATTKAISNLFENPFIDLLT
jgi:hypothetical protein